MIIKHNGKIIDTNDIHRAMRNATKVETVLALEKLAVEIALSRPHRTNDFIAWQFVREALRFGANNIRRITAQSYARTMNISQGEKRRARLEILDNEYNEFLRG